MEEECVREFPLFYRDGFEALLCDTRKLPSGIKGDPHGTIEGVIDTQRVRRYQNYCPIILIAIYSSYIDKPSLKSNLPPSLSRHWECLGFILVISTTSCLVPPWMVRWVLSLTSSRWCVTNAAELSQTREENYLYRGTWSLVSLYTFTPLHQTHG